MKISYKDLGLVFVSAILLFLVFPRFDFNILVWISLVPLLLALEEKGLKEAFFLSYLTGLLSFSVIFYWIWIVPAFKVIDFIILAAYLPHYVSLFGLGLNWVRKRSGLPAILVGPPLWVTLEYFRSHLSFLSLPWALLGHSQYLHPSLIQITSLTGVYGLSFLIVFVNVVIADVILYLRERYFEQNSASHAIKISPFISLMVAVFFLVVSYLYGIHILNKRVEGERIKAAVVQGNIPLVQGWDKKNRQVIIDRYASLTHMISQQKPALIIWPETAVRGDVVHDPELQRRIGQVAMDAKTYLLVGSSQYAKFTDKKYQKGEHYNSVSLLSPEGRIAGEYRKILLVPFGEYAPLGNLITWPEAIASEMGNTLAGNDYTLFTVEGVTLGAVICWEIIFPDHFRRFVGQGAGFMVATTNEAWFGDTAAPYQLLAISTFRAAENRVAIARSANTGISAFIDPYGRIIDRVTDLNQKDIFVEGVLIGDIPLSYEKTFYTLYGDIFVYVQAAVCMILLLYSWLNGNLGRSFQ